MAANGRLNIQVIVGLICAILAFAALYKSGGPNWSYDLIEISAMIIIIAVLLDRHEFIIKLVHVWRGGDNVDTQQLVEELTASIIGAEVDGDEADEIDKDSGDDSDVKGAGRGGRE